MQTSPPAAPEPPPPPRAGLYARFADTATGYLEEIALEGDRAGFALVRRLWAGDLVGKSTLVVLVVGAALTAYFITQPPGDATALTPTLALATILFVFAFSLALAAGTRLPLWGYALSAVYLAWFGLLPLLSMPRILTTLPVFWLLLNGWFVARAGTGRGQRVWLLLLCLGAGYLTFSGFLLSQYFPGALNLPARLLLGLLYFALLANPRALPANQALPRLPLIFGGTLALMGALVMLAVIADPAAWVWGALTSLELGLALVGLLWLALSAGAFGGAVKVGAWVGLRMRGLVTTRARSLVLLALLGVATAIEFLIIQSDTVLSGAGLVLSTGVYFALYFHAWFGIAAFAAGVAAWLVHKLTPPRAVLLFSVWLAALLALIVFFSALYSVSELDAGAFAPLPPAAALLLIWGLLWELVKSGADWSESSPPRLYGLLALVIFTLSISAALFGTGSPRVNEVSTLNSLYGVLFVAVPFLALTLLSRALHYQAVSSFPLGALFLLGWLGTVPLLLVNSFLGWELLAMPLWWLAVLCLSGTRLARLARPLDGMVAGGALAAGFVTMWMSPQTVFIPFVESLNELQKPLESLFLTRPLLQTEQLLFTLAALGVGLLVGRLAFLVRRALVRRAPVRAH